MIPGLITMIHVQAAGTVTHPDVRMVTITLMAVSYTHLSQINQVARAYVNDENFYGYGRELSMWRFYNLLTGSNKSRDVYKRQKLDAYARP